MSVGREPCSVTQRGFSIKKILWKKSEGGEQECNRRYDINTSFKATEKAKILISAFIDFQSGHITLFQKVNPTCSYCTESQNASIALNRPNQSDGGEMETLMTNPYVKQTYITEESYGLDIIYNVLAIHTSKQVKNMTVHAIFKLT